MKPVEKDEFLSIMQLENHRVFTDGRFNIVGYRSRFGRPNHFDDYISVYQLMSFGWVTYHYPATTRPGTPYLFKPVNVKGAAILVPGQYIDTYILGLHRGKYKALVQALPVAVYRDNNHDETSDEVASTIDTGLFGINIHRASLSNLVVGISSAGCQVIRDRSSYEDLIKICESSKQERFSYTLVEI